MDLSCKSQENKIQGDLNNKSETGEGGAGLKAGELHTGIAVRGPKELQRHWVRFCSVPELFIAADGGCGSLTSSTNRAA